MKYSLATLVSTLIAGVYFYFFAITLPEIWPMDGFMTRYSCQLEPQLPMIYLIWIGFLSISLGMMTSITFRETPRRIISMIMGTIGDACFLTLLNILAALLFFFILPVPDQYIGYRAIGVVLFGGLFAMLYYLQDGSDTVPATN
jgi:hypothetical protein